MNRYSLCQKLHFERLEARHLLSTLRVAAWNTLNHPNSPGDEVLFSTVLEAMGNETISGLTRRVDVLGLVETDPPSAASIRGLLNTLYATSTYSFIVSSLDGGGDATGFVYDTGSVTLVGSQEVQGALTHRILRGQFRPVGSIGDSDFFVYATHLKAGTTAANALQRANEAAIIRGNIESLSPGSDVLVMGDFNMQGSSEGAWSVFTTLGTGEVHDAANAPGSWSGNPDFRTLHSQNSQAMLNRFDLAFLSPSLWNDSGLEFLDGSYRVFGNNGTHLLGGSITTGTGAAPEVLLALSMASDHLPVVADFELVPVPKVIVAQSHGFLEAAEGVPPDSYSISLGTPPTSNVAITLTASPQLDLGFGPGVPRTLTFTPANHAIPQSIVVSAINDSDFEGTHRGAILHSLATNDPAFVGAHVPTITVDIRDNELPRLVINEADSDAPGADSMEFVEIYDGGVGGFALDGLALVLFNGNGDVQYGGVDLDGLSTDSNGFIVLGSVPGASVGLGGPLQNGADAIALYRGNPSDFPAVTTQGLIDALVYDTSDPDDPGLLPLLLPGEPQVNEDQNGLGDVQSMARVPDGGAQRRTSTYVMQTPMPGTYNAPFVAPDGDLDDDGDFDCGDIDLLTLEVYSTQHLGIFDLTNDGLVNSLDIEEWLRQAGNHNLGPGRHYLSGDATLDGVVDGSDFNVWNGSKFTPTARWCAGDFTADGVVDGSDFGVWNVNKFTASDRFMNRFSGGSYVPVSHSLLDQLFSSVGPAWQTLLSRSVVTSYPSDYRDAKSRTSTTDVREHERDDIVVRSTQAEEPPWSLHSMMHPSRMGNILFNRWWYHVRLLSCPNSSFSNR